MKSRDQGLGAKGWGREDGFRVLGAGCWKRRTGGWGVAILLTILAASLPGFAKQHAELNPAENLTIELHVYDYAGVEGSELVRAQTKAVHVLQQIGIGVTWVDCVVPAKDATNTRACPSADGQVPALILRILPRAMAERAAQDKGSLGFAQLAEDRAPASVAFVFYHRVESLAAELRCAPGVILGYALAHEVGHLLLGTNSHAPTGIMCARWTEKELRLASTGFFGFHAQQAAKMRTDVRKRITVAASAEAARTVNAASR